MGNKIVRALSVAVVLALLVAAMLTVRPLMSELLARYVTTVLHVSMLTTAKASIVLEVYVSGLALVSLLGRVGYAVWTSDLRLRHDLLSNRGTLLALLLSGMMFLVLDAKLSGLSMLAMPIGAVNPVVAQAYNIGARSWIESWLALGIVNLSLGREDGTSSWTVGLYTCLTFTGIVIGWHAMMLIF